MLAFKQAVVPGATPRERSHIAALTAWAERELGRAIALWESILGTHTHDVMEMQGRRSEGIQWLTMLAPN